MMSVPKTTLLAVDCQCPALAARALALSLGQCSYEHAKLLTDSPTLPDLDERVTLVPIPKITSAREYSRFMLKDLLRFVDTDFVQIVQWDGYVINARAWRPEFFNYDYIGARWWFRESPRNVGNGGFSLRSRRLLEALQDPAIETEGPEDDAICLEHRDLLERRHGIKIAPAHVADAYAFEGTRPSRAPFGFHRMFNFPYLYGDSELSALADAIPDQLFCSEVILTFVRILLSLNRPGEAARYAARAARYPRLPSNVRAELERLVAAEEKRARRARKAAGKGSS